MFNKRINEGDIIGYKGLYPRKKIDGSELLALSPKISSLSLKIHKKAPKRHCVAIIVRVT